ncbi:MAG: 50S ribosomal protein L3 N(5)-glutamine methyltransferase [Pseudomonadales bacterium]
MTDVAELVDRSAKRLAAAGVVFGHGFDSAWDEAVALVLHVTGLPDDRTVLGRRVADAAEARVGELLERRISERVPLAYLLGRCRFAGHEFLIDPQIVIPRSPIGALIEARFTPWLRQPPTRILDLCCGSGCIGIAGALAFPEAQVDLVDVDPGATDLAQRNVALHALGSRVRVTRSDLFEDLPDARWDLIVSNPPYVDATDMAALPDEYRHEPVGGLAGGADGLDLVARIIAALPERLDAAGALVCEVGASAPALLARYPHTEFIWPELPAGGEGVFLLWGTAAPR